MINNQTQIDVSVIVPVYNSEQFLPQCIDSILNQTLKNIELIFVDDGSTDNSLKIIEEYKKKDERISVYEQKNLYAGVARNTGFSHAKGKYVIFLDSDDFFEATMLEEAFNSAERNNAQAVLFGYDFYNENEKSYRCEDYSSKLAKFNGTFSAGDLGENVFSCLFAVPWNRLVLSQYLKDNAIEFTSAPKHNDSYWAHMVVVCADRMTFINKIFVHYRVNNAASIQGNTNKNVVCSLRAAVDLKRGLTERGLINNPDIKAAYNKVAEGFIRSPLLTIRDMDSMKNFYDNTKQMLIPSIYDSADSFSKDSMPYEVYTSSTFEEFLWQERNRLNNQLENDYVPKTSKDYKIGSAVLKLPRKIKSLLK